MKGLVINDTTVNYQTSLNIVGGTTYKVKIRALNKYGWGPFGSYATIRCAKVPNVVTGTTVTTTNNTLWMDISWVAPFNNGLTITKYTVQIKKKDGSWANAPTSECDGANAVIVANTRCSVLMSTLRSSSFSLALNDQVLA